LLKVDLEKERPNEFFDQLQPDVWEHDEGYRFPYDSLVDLNTIVEGGAKLFYNKSFYFYLGSQSRPPCEEGVFHFVFDTPILVTQSQLNAVQRSAFNHELEPISNSREA
jgi:carbonic anhydrase